MNCHQAMKTKVSSFGDSPYPNGDSRRMIKGEKPNAVFLFLVHWRVRCTNQVRTNGFRPMRSCAQEQGVTHLLIRARKKGDERSFHITTFLSVWKLCLSLSSFLREFSGCLAFGLFSRSSMFRGLVTILGQENCWGKPSRMPVYRVVIHQFIGA